MLRTFVWCWGCSWLPWTGGRYFGCSNGHWLFSLTGWCLTVHRAEKPIKATVKLGGALSAQDGILLNQAKTATRKGISTARFCELAQQLISHGKWAHCRKVNLVGGDLLVLGGALLSKVPILSVSRFFYNNIAWVTCASILLWKIA